jgi:hypothetical protein
MALLKPNEMKWLLNKRVSEAYQRMEKGGVAQEVHEAFL